MNIQPIRHQTDRWAVICPAGFEGTDKRKFRYFGTRTAAADFCKIVNRWRHARKGPQIGGTITVTECETALVAILRAYNIQSAPQLSEILSRDQRINSVIKISLRAAVENFLRHVQTEEKPRAAYLADITGKLNRFASEFPGSEAHELDRLAIKEYLSDWENAATRNQHLKRLGKFFNWLRQEQHIMVDPTQDLNFSKVDQKENIEIYTVEQATKLMQTADSDYKSIAPWVALGLFGFLRSSEIQRLDWSAIDFEKGSITVASSIAKTGKRRVIELNETLRHWLQPYAMASGSVVAGLNGEISQCFAAAGLTRLHNGLRHSCVSYAAKVNGLDEVFMQAGHSPSVSLRHYIEGMTRAEATPYWEIRRQ